MQLTPDKLARFWAKVTLGPGCWDWSGATDSSGYGRFAAVGRTLHGAHRVAYCLDGAEIPAGMVIDHICRNRLCVNPAHLRCVDRRTNVHENSAAPAHLNALKTHCPQGHAYDGDNLVIRVNGFRRCRECERIGQVARRAKQAPGESQGSAVAATSGETPKNSGPSGEKAS